MTSDEPFRWWEIDEEPAPLFRTAADTVIQIPINLETWRNSNWRLRPHP